MSLPRDGIARAKKRLRWKTEPPEGRLLIRLKLKLDLSDLALCACNRNSDELRI